jgi:hypothetical protein
MRLAATLALFAALLGSPVWAAQGTAAPKPPQQVELTAPLVERFIASYKPVDALGKQYDAKWGKEDFSDPKADELTQMRQNLEAKGALTEFDRLVGQYGFASFAQWLPVYYSTVMAYGFGDPKNELSTIEARLQKSLGTIEKSPKLTPEQKAEYAKAVQQSMASYAALKPPGQNIAVVRPYQAQLHALFGDIGTQE